MSEDYAVYGEVRDKAHGVTKPRIYTPPLRKLDKTTSNGFAVIAFAELILHVHLYPWQCWLLIHALELLEDGSYRFRRIIVLVARQNGKTTVMGVLAAWWLFIDSSKHPDKVPPVKFLVVGAAQTLDNAKGPYETVKTWCNPAPATEEESELACADLQPFVQRISNVNGEEGIICRSKAKYVVRAANNIRSKSAARAIFDELREQHTEDGWNSVSQITKAVWSSQLWGISNAGDHRSVVLKKQVDKGRRLVEDWNAYVARGVDAAQRFANGEKDASFGYFEWSAEDKCELDDDEAIRQSNPSVGYGPMTLQSIKSDIDGMTEAAYRTEVLCQWVTADIIPYIDPKIWKAGEDKESAIPVEGRVVLAVDTSADRTTTYVAAAGHRADGLPHVELIARRDGMLWVPAYLRRLRDSWPSITEVAVQSKGCPAVDFVDLLAAEGWTVHCIEGFKLGACCGRFLDRIKERKLKHLPQPAIDQQVSVAVSRRLGEVQVWDRQNSALQISGLIAQSEALYALETTESTQPKQTASAYAEHGLMIL
ncbi:terminase [Bifidobacterium panos]|uniref:Terminase n=1 Tax=Bifidobacterium panos TaxID=2675321 RepID=A0ABX1T0P2_9BIFI|nr:terminase [Bifidobacterium sp. DSM 109963]NMN02728.1 terminase [Bifidobacterium sp. DSM 109963]